MTALKSQNVKVKFVNRTGFDLDSLVAQDAIIGDLKNDSTSKIITFKEITMDSGIIPIINLKSKIQYRQVTISKMPYDCATSWKRVMKGSYTVYIYYEKNTDEEFLIPSLTDKPK